VKASTSCRGLRSRPEQGYILLALLLVFGLLAIGTAVVIPTITRQVQRDQEEELIHRAAQYRRAIREFTKGKGRYPATVEELAGSNGIRYLRRPYKDPITHQDFRMLHASDVIALTGAPPLAGKAPPDDGSGASQDPNSAAVAASSAPSSAPALQSPTDGGIAPPQNSSPSAPSSLPSAQTGLSAPASPSTTFGGGPIIGVASSSSKKTIREFNGKNHYNQWLFFYDPGYEPLSNAWGPTPWARPVQSLLPPSPAQSSPAQSGSPQQSPAQPSSQQ